MDGAYGRWGRVGEVRMVATLLVWGAVNPLGPINTVPASVSPPWCCFLCRYASTQINLYDLHLLKTQTRRHQRRRRRSHSKQSFRDGERAVCRLLPPMQTLPAGRPGAALPLTSQHRKSGSDTHQHVQRRMLIHPPNHQMTNPHTNPR